MRHARLSIDIAAPPDRVWAVMSDVERWEEWTPSVTRITRLGQAAPLAIGSRVLIRQPRFPPALWRVAAIEPGRNFTWISNGPGIRVIARHGIEPAGAGSRATLSLEYQGIFGGLLGRWTRGITERYLRFEADGLKARSENPAFRHSGNADIIDCFQADRINIKSLERILGEVEKWNMKIEDPDTVSRLADDAILRDLKLISTERDTLKRLQRLNRLFPLLKKFKLAPELSRCQNIYFEISLLHKKGTQMDKEWMEQFLLLGDNLGVKLE